jgi:hypothetical protein
MLEELKTRKENLIKGLEGLYKQQVNINNAIEIQKGAISECEYWESQLLKDKEENKIINKLKK